MAATRKPRGVPDLAPGPALDLVDLFTRLRETHHLTNGQVVARTGMSPGHVSDVFTGWRPPRPATAEALAKALRGTPSEIERARFLAERLAELNRHNRQRERHSPAPAQPATQPVAPPQPVAQPAGYGTHRFQLLGPVLVHGAAGPVDVGGATARATLAALLFRGDAGATTDDLVTWVWGGPGAAGRPSVYRYISSLRSALLTVPGAVLAARRSPYRLKVDPDSVDWHRFRRLTGQARAARAADRTTDAADLLREALALWQGDPLADIGDRLDEFRRQMSTARRNAAESLAEIALATGDPGTVLDLRDVLLAGAVREHGVALMIDAYNALGQRDDAGELYRHVHARLSDEHGLEPSAELVAAHQRALTGTGVAPASAQQAGRPISDLPRPDPHFTGRAAVLSQIVAAVGHRPEQPCVISGMGGLGKTALAVQAAGLLADTYPDGVLFLDLFGWTDSRPPLTTVEALDRLLHRMRIDGRLVPSDPDERAAFYRDHLADRRLLLVLDNARDSAQVRALLPRDPHTGVLVTSRSRLTALDDVMPVSLDLLDHDEAVALFRSIGGGDRIDREPDAGQTISRIVDRCGLLPLAVRIAASRYRGRDRQPLTTLEMELSDARSALDGLEDDERSVAATLRVSLTHLPAETVRTFTLVARHPGAEVDAYAAAAMTDRRLGETARQLGALVDANLLAEHAPGRYRFHDLVGGFAREQPADDAASGFARMAGYYLSAAERADQILTPMRYRPPRPPAGRPSVLPAMADYPAALVWLTVEQGNLADVCVAAGAAGLDVVCWHLAFTLRGYYYLTKNWQLWLATHEAALASARRLGDPRAEALILDNIGRARLEQGRPDEAVHLYREAMHLFAAAGDGHGENTARADLAWLAYSAGRFVQFLDESRPVLEFYVRTGAERNAAITRRGIGLAKAALGRTAEATADFAAALEVFERSGLWLDATMTWNGLGENHQLAGDFDAAREAFQAGLIAADRAGTVYERARARHRLGEIARAEGRVVLARDHFGAALSDYHGLGAPEAAIVEREVSSLPADFQID